MKKKLSLSILLVVLIMLFAVPSQAKTVTVKSKKFTTNETIAAKNTVKVKTGTTVLKLKGESGYVKFTAPRTGKYKFTFSNLKPQRAGSFSCGYAYIMEKTSYGIGMKTIKTEGGKDNTIRISTKNDTSGTKISRYLKKRTAATTLTKGETVYIYCSFFTKDTLTMNIKAL